MPCSTWTKLPVQASLQASSTDLAARSYLLTQGAEHICGPHAPAVHLPLGRAGAPLKHSTHWDCLRLRSIDCSFGLLEERSRMPPDWI